MPGPSPLPMLLMGGAVLPVAFLVALLAVFVYAGTTAKKGGERDRRAEMGFASVVIGPAVGALLAWARVARGGINPLDVGDTFMKHAGLGLIAGVMMGLAFGLSAVFAPGEVPKKPPTAPEA